MLAHAIKQDEQNWQDRVGGSLQEQAYARPGTSLVFNSQFRRLSEALQWQPGMHILDVGCGVEFVSVVAARARRNLPGR